MSRLLVGLPTLVGDIQKYKDRFDMVELRPVDTSVPKERTLRTWRKQVPPGFVFSVVLPRVVGELNATEAAEAAIKESLAVATVIEARCVVLVTPPSVRPTSVNKKRIEALFARVRMDGVAACWEPQGLWERDEIIGLAKSMDVVPVFDAAREGLGPGAVVYTRLRALGQSNVIGARTVDKIAERLESRREAFVVVESPGVATRLRKALRDALATPRTRGRGPTVLRPASSTALVADDEEQ